MVDLVLAPGIIALLGLYEVRCGWGIARFILVVLCIAGCFTSTSIRGSRYDKKERGKERLVDSRR